MARLVVATTLLASVAYGFMVPNAVVPVHQRGMQIYQSTPILTPV